MQNSRARIPPPQRDCGGWDALVRARAARVPAPPTLPRLCPEDEASSHATPHAAPLKRGEDARAPTRPAHPRDARPRGDGRGREGNARARPSGEARAARAARAGGRRVARGARAGCMLLKCNRRQDHLRFSHVLIVLAGAAGGREGGSALAVERARASRLSQQQTPKPKYGGAQMPRSGSASPHRAARALRRGRFPRSGSASPHRAARALRRGRARIAFTQQSKPSAIARRVLV